MPELTRLPELHEGLQEAQEWAVTSSEVLQDFIRMGVIPWAIWVTISIFNQRQQIALIRQEISLLEEIKKMIKRGDR